MYRHSRSLNFNDPRIQTQRLLDSQMGFSMGEKRPKAVCLHHTTVANSSKRMRVSAAVSVRRTVYCEKYIDLKLSFHDRSVGWLTLERASDLIALWLMMVVHR